MSDDLVPQAETAFIVVREFDGSYRATADLEQAFIVNRVANLNDIRQASRDLLDKITEDSIAETVANKLAGMRSTDSERATKSIKEALEGRRK